MYRSGVELLVRLRYRKEPDGRFSVKEETSLLHSLSLEKKKVEASIAPAGCINAKKADTFFAHQESRPSLEKSGKPLRLRQKKERLISETIRDWKR